jgi:hypothetical protein
VDTGRRGKHLLRVRPPLGLVGIEEQAMGPDPATETTEAAQGYDIDARAERRAAYPRAAAGGYEIVRDRGAGFEAGLAAVVAGIGLTLLGPGHENA